jgi:DMSO reductase family type II enzyme heme b subunit
MKAARVDAADDTLLDASSAAWRGAETKTLPLQATPLVMQPSEYVQAKWEDLGHGALPELSVAASHNGSTLFFRLEWRDDTDDSQPDDMSRFPDQAAVMLPIKETASMMEMGTAEEPVNMWLWRGDQQEPLYVTAMGRGTAIRHPDRVLAGSAVWRDGRWRVVIGRPFHVSLPVEQIVPLAPGVTHKCTFAVWQGAAQERAGLKAYHPLWEPLEVER